MAPGRWTGSRALLSEDTSPEIERRLVELWQAMGPARRLSSAAGACAALAQLALTGARSRAGKASESEIFGAFAEAGLGRDLAARVYGERPPRGYASSGPMNLLQVVVLVARALEACSVRYVVGGSLASSIGGEPRATLDADLMVDLAAPAVDCLMSHLGADFYADAVSFERAIRQRSCVRARPEISAPSLGVEAPARRGAEERAYRAYASDEQRSPAGCIGVQNGAVISGRALNVIHLPSATKVDLFVMGASAIEPRQMERRLPIALDDPAGATLFVYTPEDILL